jgi:hypothetical protein
MRYEQKRVIQTVVGSYSPDLKADRLRYTKSLTLYAVCSSGTSSRKALILPMTDKLNPKPNPKFEGDAKHQKTNDKNQTCLRQASLSAVADKLQIQRFIPPRAGRNPETNATINHK